MFRVLGIYNFGISLEKNRDSNKRVETFKHDPYFIPAFRLFNRGLFNKNVYKNWRGHRTKKSVTNPCVLR